MLAQLGSRFTDSICVLSFYRPFSPNELVAKARTDKTYIYVQNYMKKSEIKKTATDASADADYTRCS